MYKLYWQKTKGGIKMSLYNKLFGMNEETPILLGMIGVNKEYFARFRDVFLCNGGRNIRVYTRSGGQNRETFKDNWKTIIHNPLYAGDYDDGSDETYAYIEFNIPDKYKETAKKMFKEEPITVWEKFHNECEEMKIPGTPAYDRAKEIADIIMEKMENNKDDGGITIIKL